MKWVGISSAKWQCLQQDRGRVSWPTLASARQGRFKVSLRCSLTPESESVLPAPWPALTISRPESHDTACPGFSTRGKDTQFPGLHMKDTSLQPKR